MLFESNVLYMWTQLSADKLGIRNRQYEATLLRRRGSVLRKLHFKLGTPELGSQESTIMTVISLIAADVSNHVLWSVTVGS